MTIRDQIPSFPELISFYEVMNEVAHGTSDHNRISGKYYSSAERDYVEDLAAAKISNLLREGRIRATGRVSEIKKGSAKRWQAQQYKQHSKVRSYIEPEFWRTAFVPGRPDFLHSARVEGKEYTDILLVVQDCAEHLADELEAHRDEAADTAKEPTAAVSNYSTPYIDLMWLAIDHFKISNENQPIKENLVEWFLSQEIAGQKVSRATAEYLASFVRLPTSRLGGNRPWKVRAQQQPQHQ